VGAVASLTRSVAPFSINSPHTGGQNYGGGVIQIPAACITIEDAEMFQRMQDRGQKIVVKLYMEAQNYPNETVIVSGHLDSWDVGTGAMDDGGGAAISWSVLSLIKMLNLKPKRTIRLVMWSCEEFGGIGGQQYYQQHSDQLNSMNLVMESDLGVFHPDGIQFTGTDPARQIMQGVGALLKSINATEVTTGGEGTDISPWINHGVPGASLANENQKYFMFHHSQGDTMTVLDTADVDLCAAVWAVTAYVVADLDDMLPR
jgi:carboxypeptidase Q